MSDHDSHPYARLLPETVLDAVEQCGFQPTGGLFALNSYENRVYQIALEDGRFLVGKFYRPERFSDEALQEEHSFALELAEAELPVIAPLANSDGKTLFEHAGFRFALYPRVGGRYPNLEDPELLFRLGRLVGRIHAIGALRPFHQRPRIEVAAMGETPYRYLLEQGFIPSEHRQRYRDLAEALLTEIGVRFQGVSPLTELRLHGDLHPGNILQRDEQIAVVDTDDCRSGPAVQDLWLLLSPDREQMERDISELVEGYEEFYEFRLRELELIEPLRTLRMIHYAYWLAVRWKDPAFPHHFPWFNSGRYWDDHMHALIQQLERMELPPPGRG